MGRIKRVWWRGSEDAYNFEGRGGSKVGIREYLNALKSRDYSFLLNDGGIVQMQLDYKGHSVQKYRYAYLPCPISLADSEDSDLYADGENGTPLKGDIDIMNESDFRGSLVMVAPLRFEWDREQELEHEPKSHVHLGVSDGRVAVSHPVSVWNFLRFVLKNFYPREFEKFEELPKFKRDKVPGISKAEEACIRDHEKRHAYISVPHP